MCFYLKTAAPEQSLDVVFYNESIWFEKNGKNVVQYDLIIQNTGSEPINTLTIIYPKSFLENTKAQHPTLHKVYSFIQHYIFRRSHKGASWRGFLDDRSEEWLEENNDWNNYLEEYSFNSFKRKKNGTIAVKIKDINDPYNRKKGTRYEGTVYNNTESINRHDKVKLGSMIQVLNELNYSILQYSSDSPLHAKETRFIRWCFFSEESTINNPGFFSRTALKAINELYYNYILFSPDNVYNLLKEKLTFELKTIESGKTFNKQPHETTLRITAIRSLLKIINKKTGRVTRKCQRFLLFPRKLRTLINIVPFGNIHPLGLLQNFPPLSFSPPTFDHGCIKEKTSSHVGSLWRRRVYRWTSMRALSNTGRNNNPDNFLLYITARYHCRLFQLLPYFLIVFILLSIYYQVILIQLLVKMGIIVTNVYNVLLSASVFILSNYIVWILSFAALVGAVFKWFDRILHVLKDLSKFKELSKLISVFKQLLKKEDN